MSWDERWLSLATLVASWSKDRSRKVGAVIVDDRQNLLAIGWNGFPRGVDDDVEERHERPIKYEFTEHAERNAIFNAAASGVGLIGSTIYLQWYPCSDCSRGIVQSGISNVVCGEPDWKDPQWGKSFEVSRQILKEGNATVRS